MWECLSSVPPFPRPLQVTDVAAELSFILPSASTGQFPSLFHNLESELTHLFPLCALVK